MTYKTNRIAELISNVSEELQKPVSKHEIDLWIDCYDDVFSDFDLRPFSARNISDDFLHEVKKVSHESDAPVNELKLLMPQKARNEAFEAIITKRLHSHFVKNQHYFLKKKRTARKKDFLFICAGIAMMTCASLVSSAKSSYFLMHTLLMIIEPAGWFLVWTGMGNIIESMRVEKPELDFYNKMLKSKVTFLSL